MKENLKYSKICALIRGGLSDYLPERYIDVMFDSHDYVYYVKIKNQFGVGEYTFPWSTVMKSGTDIVVDTIKRDFIFPKECEE